MDSIERAPGDQDRPLEPDDSAAEPGDRALTELRDYGIPADVGLDELAAEHDAASEQLPEEPLADTAPEPVVVPEVVPAAAEPPQEAEPAAEPPPVQDVRPAAEPEPAEPAPPVRRWKPFLLYLAVVPLPIDIAAGAYLSLKAIDRVDVFLVPAYLYYLAAVAASAAGLLVPLVVAHRSVRRALPKAERKGTLAAALVRFVVSVTIVMVMAAATITVIDYFWR